MGDPITKTVRNQRTGAMDTVSSEDGKTWRLVSSAPAEPLNELTLPYDSGDTGPKPGFGDLRTIESQLPTVQVGAGETAAREIGGDLGAGMGDRLRGHDRAAHNRETERLGGIPRQRGRTFSAEDQKLWSADDYIRDEMARRSAGQALNPRTAMTANMAGNVAQAVATPAFRGATLGTKLLAGAGNIAADTGIAAGTAALTAQPGMEADAARAAAAPAAAFSAALRTPGMARETVRGARNALTSALPPETAAAARTFTDLGPEGRAARQAAREGQRDLDPQVRKITALGSDIETTRDQLLNWARTGGTKKRAIQDAMARDAGAAAVDIPRPPRVPSDAPPGKPMFGPEPSPDDTLTIRPPAPAPRSGGAPRPDPAPGKPFFGSEPLPDDSVTMRAPAGFQPQRSIGEAGAFAERQTLELEAMLANADDLGPASRQAIRKLKELSASTQDKITEALAASGDDAPAAAADAYHALDLYKQRLGQLSSNLSGGADNRLTQQQLRRMYEDLRQTLEREDVAGPTMAGSQRRVNAAWTDELTQRDRYRSTMLTPDSAKRGADPFEDLLEADPRKVSGVLSNAGAATNDLAERSMREGMGSTSKLVRSLADEYHAPPELRAKAQQLGTQVDQLLAEFDAVKGNLSRAREAREVAGASGIVGKGINTVGAVEEAVRNSPALSAVARGGAAVGRAGRAVAEPGRKLAATQVGANAAAQQTRQGSENALDDEKYGPLLARKQGKDREAAYSILMAQDPQFRSRQRAKAAQAEGD